jgi:hypothetical protein
LNRLTRALSILIGTVVATIPFVPAIADPLGLEGADADIMLAIAAIAVAYVAANEAAKRLYKRWIQERPPDQHHDEPHEHRGFDR